MQRHEHQYRMVSGGMAMCELPGCEATLFTSGPVVRGGPVVRPRLLPSHPRPVMTDRSLTEAKDVHVTDQEEITLADAWEDLRVALVEFGLEVERLCWARLASLRARFRAGRP